MRAKLAPALAALVLTVGAHRATAATDGPPTISDIRQESTDRSTRLVIECTGPLAYTYYSPDPLTLVVDIPEADASKIPSRIPVGTREVESLRVTNMARADGRFLTRLEVRLASLVPYQIYSKDRNLNLVFERAAGGSASAAPPSAAPAPAPPPTVAVEVPPVAAAEVQAPAVVEAPSAAATPTAAAPPPAGPTPAAKTTSLATPAPAPVSPARPATRIIGVTSDTGTGQLSVRVAADGTLRYQDFYLGNPDRLVIDFQGVAAKSQAQAVESGPSPVRKIRLGQFSAGPPRVARLVLDLASRSPYQIADTADGVQIVFGEGGQTPKPAPLAALRTEPVEPQAATAPSAPLAPPQVPPLSAAPAPVPISVEPQAAGAEQFEPAVVQSSQKNYTGDPISLDFKDGDLQDIFRLFADISGLNVVVNPGISGKVTLKLTQVPWDQALDIILKTNGLGRVTEENVIRIARLTDLQREEDELRKLKENQALAGDLLTLKKSLSYAKASELEPTLRKVVLSSRGNITLDTRTNTMIITDLPQRLEDAKDLINLLDRQTPQVEIEARIVITSRNFTRDIGIQWGFLSQQTNRYGNTTDRTFPNQIILNGVGVPSTQGIPADGGVADSVTTGIGAADRGYAVNLPAASFTSGIGINLGNILGNFSLDAALTALENQGRGRLLSTPKVTTQNNQEAEIKQGVQIPIQTTANNTVSVQFKDAVLTLKVTPQITDAGTVVLKLEVENNTADFSREVNGIPPINTQSAKTNVLVRDGATTVIGGIYQSTEQANLNSVPFFAKLPIVGYLFRNRTARTQNDELLIFITPRIVKS